MRDRIIVTMTSYPKRIGNVAKSIFALLKKQTLPPDEIHLWLAIPQFPKKEKDLPEDLQAIVKLPKVFLHWLPKNTYVHKRHEYFKIAHQNDCVFLIDDDVRYANDLIERVMNTHQKYPNCIVCYNPYESHTYDGVKIRYHKRLPEDRPMACHNRWCGQSMIPAKIYPIKILSASYQAIRNRTSPISDECWFQPWTVYYDIPIYHLDYDWGTDLDTSINKWDGLCKYSHQRDTNGLERRDNWLNAVLKSFPEILEKYKRLFNYGN